MTDTKEKNGLQAIIDEAWKNWGSGMSREDFVYTLDGEQEFAVIVGAFNYQVENGGFSQWYYNNYMANEIDDLIVYVRTMPETPTVKAVLNLLTEADMILGYCREVESDSGAHGCYEECDDFDEWGYCDHTENGGALDEQIRSFEDLDNQYYKVNEDFLQEVWSFIENGMVGEKDCPGPKRTQHTKPHVQLTGTDGNAFALIGKVSEALKKAGLRDQIEEMRKETMSGDYNHLLRVLNNYVEIS